MTPSQVTQMPSRGMKAVMLYIDDWRASWNVQAMDNDERMAYLNLLMFAASQPDGGIPDSDTDLAVYSELGLRWWRPTRVKAKRRQKQDTETGEFLFKEDGKPEYMSCGDKIRQCFSFRPKTAQSPDGRLYNERMYEERSRFHNIKDKRQEAADVRWGRNKGESNSCKCMPDASEKRQKLDAKRSHLPPPTSVERDISSLPPPPSTTDEPTGVVAERKQTATQNANENQCELQRHCSHLGLPPPTAELTDRIVKKFHPLSIVEIIQYLPKFEGQNSPGLWDHRSRRDLEIEASEQLSGKRKQMSKIDALFEKARIART